MILLASVAVLFGPALVSQSSFVFRDAAHYYYPLFDWTAREWGEGRIPTWNPQEDLGVPITADATSSVFYPAKILFALPCSFPLRYKLYIIGHVFLAALGAYCLARHHRCGSIPAAMAGLSYALGGSVVFQYCNVVYLIGAAWLPFAIADADWAIRRRSRSHAVRLGVVLALMILGGDVLCAYHTLLFIVLFAWLARPGTMRARMAFCTTWQPLLLSVVTMFVLAAVQFLPSFYWAKEGTRTAISGPRSIYEIPFYFGHSSNCVHADFPEEHPTGKRQWATLLGATHPETHHAEVFDFSVAPWRLAELVWPNITGRPFPTNQRWITAIPAEGRSWTPSLYVGLLPFVLSVLTLRYRRGQTIRRWYSWMAVLAIIAGMGVYGLGWLCDEIRFGLGHNQRLTSIGPSFGGLYWAMTSLLPGYVYFRYPAKIWVFANLALSQLGAIGWRYHGEFDSRRLTRSVGWVLIATLLGGLVYLLGSAPLRQFISGARSDTLFGPIVVDEAMGGIGHSLLHTTILCGGLLAIFWAKRNGSLARSFGQVCLGLVALDLLVATWWMIPLAPASAWQPDPQPMKGVVFRETRNYYPPAWFHTSSDQRPLDGLVYDRQTLYPRYALLSGTRVLGSRQGMRDRDIENLIRELNQLSFAQRQLILRERFGVSAIVTTDHKQGSWHGWTSEPIRQGFPARLLRTTALAPRIRIVHKTQRIELTSRGQCWHCAREGIRSVIAYAAAGNLDAVTVDGEVDKVAERMFATETPPHDERSSLDKVDKEVATIVTESPQRIEIMAQLNSPGMVVLGDLYSRGWSARIRTAGTDGFAHELPIVCCDGVLRGVWLPAGRFTIVQTYRQPGLKIGAWMSGIGWLSLLLSGLAVGRKRRRSRLAVRNHGSGAG